MQTIAPSIPFPVFNPLYPQCMPVIMATHPYLPFPCLQSFLAEILKLKPRIVGRTVDRHHRQFHNCRTLPATHWFRSCSATFHGVVSTSNVLRRWKRKKSERVRIATLSRLPVPSSVVVRADGKYQVRQCLGFSTADVWSLLAYESAE